MWYCNRARRYFTPWLEKRKALIRRPKFWKALLEGAKMVTRFRASSRDAARPVFRRPRVRVLNWVGTRLKREREEGGGRRMESMPWIRPFEAVCCRHR